MTGKSDQDGDLSPQIGGMPEDNSPGLPSEWEKAPRIDGRPCRTEWRQYPHPQPRLSEVLFNVVVELGSSVPEDIRRSLDAAGWQVTRVASNEPANSLDYPTVVFQGFIPYSSDNAIREWASAFQSMPGVLNVKIEHHLINRNVVDNPGIHRGYLQRAFQQSRSAIEELTERMIRRALDQTDEDVRHWMIQRIDDEHQRLHREVSAGRDDHLLIIDDPVGDQTAVDPEGDDND